VVWEINHSGNWILPLRNGDEIPSKPPLYHWLAALVSQSVGRLDEFTARVPSAFLATLGVLLVYFTGTILSDRSAGFISASILATSVEWEETARVARVDMTLTFVLLCAFLFFLYLYQTEGSRTKAAIMGFLLGLATLAKGPLGFVVPCFTYLVFLWARKDLVFIKKIHPVLIIGTCAVVGGVWYALALWQGGGDFLAVVVKENFSMTVGREAGHPHAFSWYVPVFFQKMAPWSLFFIPAAIWLYRVRRRLAEENLLYLVVWFATVFLFFSAFTQKRSVYILSVYPAVALLLGAWWRKMEQSQPAADSLFSRPAAYVSAASFVLGSGVLLFQIFGQGIVPISPAAVVSKGSSQNGDVGEPLARASARNIRLGFGWRSGRTVPRGAGEKKSLESLLRNYDWANDYLVGFCAEVRFLPGPAIQLQIVVQQVLETADDAPLYFYRSGDFGVVFYADRRIPIYDSLPSASDDSLPYLLVWEKDWKNATLNNPLTLINTSESTDPMGKGRLLLVRVANKQE
jgi:4-amino-4-deoxy-L-arabinose transferase-like glycosyltransferase